MADLLAQAVRCEQALASETMRADVAEAGLEEASRQGEALLGLLTDALDVLTVIAETTTTAGQRTAPAEDVLRGLVGSTRALIGDYSARTRAVLTREGLELP